jgi:hypothetical protein
VKTNKIFWSYLAQFFSKWEMYKKILQRKSKHVLCSETIFLRKSCLLLDNMKNIVGPDSRIAQWIRKSANTVRIRMCNTYCFSTSIKFARTFDCYAVRTMPVFFHFFPKFYCDIWALDTRFSDCFEWLM